MAKGRSSEPTQTRVRWNNREKSMLIERGRQLMASGTTNPLEALRGAQDVLPVDRQRKLATISQAQWFVSGLKKRGPGRPSAAVAMPAVAASGGGGGVSLTRDDLRDAIVEAVMEIFAHFAGAARGPAPARRGRPSK